MSNLEVGLAEILVGNGAVVSSRGELECPPPIIPARKVDVHGVEQGACLDDRAFVGGTGVTPVWSEIPSQCGTKDRDGALASREGAFFDKSCGRLFLVSLRSTNGGLAKPPERVLCTIRVQQNAGG